MWTQREACTHSGVYYIVECKLTELKSFITGNEGGYFLLSKEILSLYSKAAYHINIFAKRIENKEESVPLLIRCLETSRMYRELSSNWLLDLACIF